MELRDLIRVLGDGHYHSGEELGERFHVSRTAIWKQLKKLEGIGLELDAVRGLGYCLSAPVELLDGSRIVGALGFEARRRLARLFIEMQIDSTNSFVLERFKQGAGHGEVCFAELQEAGRGRRGRGWQATMGTGLTFSLGWRFQVQAAQLQGLSLAVGVAIARALRELGINIELKWPNDLLIRDDEGRLNKLGGVLVELQGDAEGPCDVVVGIGLNVSAAPAVPEGQGLPGGYLEQVSGSPLSRNILAAALVSHVGSLLDSYVEEGFSPLREEWERLNAMSGQDVNVHQSGQVYTASVEGVDDQGSLIVNYRGERQRLTGGEVTLRPVQREDESSS